MKKLALLLVAVILILAFVGCGEAKNNDSTNLSIELEPIEYIPSDDVVSIGKYNDFHYTEYTDYIEITDCSVKRGQTHIEFPSGILGKPVTKISVATLQNNTDLKSAVIPNTVTEIGNHLFAYCNNLESVTLPSGLKKVGCAAFYDTPWFESLNDEFVIVGDGVLIKYNGDGGDITVPDNVKYLSDAFSENSHIWSVTINANVVGLSDYAFYNCSSLSMLSIPSHISDIGSHAFNNTTWLLAESDDFVVIGNNVLIAYNGSDTEVIVPDGIKYIAGAFADNTTVTKITVPKSVQCIRTSSFYGCTSLESVEFLSDDTFIESAAFANCTNLTSINLPKNLKVISPQLFYSCTSLQNITIPKDTLIIGRAAFYNNSHLTSVTCNSSLIGVDSGAFFGCVRLPKLNLPDSVEFIGEVALASCYELSEFTLPPKVTTIPLGLFSYCVTLNELSFGEQVKSIGEGAFEGCSTLSVYIEGAETTLDKDVFLSCEGSDYKIYCKKGSVAEKYAKENKIKYINLK